jgi:hypothetical protein
MRGRLGRLASPWRASALHNVQNAGFAGIGHRTLLRRTIKRREYGAEVPGENATVLR